MPLVSLSARLAANAQATDQIPVMLLTITHPDIPGPTYLSSDPTQRLSDDPLIYGTISNGIEYPFVIMSAVLPDDQEDNPPKTTLVFDSIGANLAPLIRASTSPATVRIDVVMAATPDDLELTFTDLRGIQGTYDATSISYDVSREPLTSEPCPAGRMTQSRFPGLHS